ncbi:nitroreductase/quinone reductase family protein [Nocardioides terrisoli]|uniref:nitroreductase/quinone reductase family protein n=1 Tax=Nocardioides terrisoli TaxID=3388267 RepID=UPI00287BB4A0|nr:nitroreductase/quinone reductase family protein [Nocardioides marmorisolisilvae]
MVDHNAQIIDEFRANGGRVGGGFEGAPLLLLHSTGARTGQERVSPMMYQAVGDAYAVFASKAGADTHPDWFHNLTAHPEARIEVGVDGEVQTVDVTARVLDAEEREPIWSTQKERFPGFADYEAKTTRVIPVVLLERVRGTDDPADPGR